MWPEAVRTWNVAALTRSMWSARSHEAGSSPIIATTPPSATGEELSQRPAAAFAGK